MKKNLLYCVATIGLLCLNACQTIEQLAIDYMLPAEISFPENLKRVGIVNNMPDTPENKLITSAEDKKKDETEIARRSDYYNGDSRIATEALAQAIANENYFDLVVICDSALRSKDITPREATLSGEEIARLTRDLGVDFLIALENVQFHSLRKVSFLPDWRVFYGTVDVNVYPTVRVYLPGRKIPMVTVNCSDSIFWDAYSDSKTRIFNELIDEKDMLQQASEFAGTMYTKKVTEDLFSQYYPTLSCYDSLKIEYLRTEESGLGYGRAFINLAKIQSRKEGCNGRVHLDASRVYTPRRPPHIFYRKCGFTSIYQDRIKYIDECIRKHKQLHWSMADNLPMYLPLKKENTRKVSFYSKILSYINKLKKLSQ